MLLFLCLMLLSAKVLSQGLPASPCPQVFQYEARSGEGWYGHILVPAPRPRRQLHVTARLFIRAALTNAQYGHLGLRKNRDEVAGEIFHQNTRTVDYEVQFPTQSPLPVVQQITANNIIICQGPPVPARPGVFTKIFLEHTLYPFIRQTGSKPSHQQSSQKTPENQLPTHYNQTSPNPIPTYQRPNTNTSPTPSPGQLDYDSQIYYEKSSQNPRLHVIPHLRPEDTNPKLSDIRQRWRPLDESDNEPCGVAMSGAQPLVVRGAQIDRGEWPWLAALYLAKEMSFMCGGSLINMGHVITAGHCIRGRDGLTKAASEVVTVLGKYDLKKWVEPRNQNRVITEIRLHPDFDYLTLAHDIAVLVLESKVEYTLVVRPVCLWDTDVGVNLVVGRVGTVVGWGRDENQMTTTGKPNKVRVPIVSQEECLRSNAAFRDFTNEATLCAGDKDGSGPCTGDSGGPLLLNKDLSDGTTRWYLRGIVSHSLTDIVNMTCDLNEYVVYTDVAKYLDWLKQFTLDY